MKIIHKKLCLTILLIVFAAIFIIMNIVILDGKYYFRFSTDVFLNNCTNEDAGKLESMPFIERLEIRNCSSNDISFIENKKFLKELSILKYNGDWSSLKKCKQLKSFAATNSTFDDFTYFSEMTQLEKLDLAVFSNDVQINSISGIQDLKSLKYLNLNGLKEEDVNLINRLSDLEFFGLSFSDILYINIELEKVKYINLSHNPKLEKCTFSNKCIDLQSITISDCSEIDIDIEELINLPNLKEVKLTEEIFTAEEKEKLIANGIMVIVN